ncbi:hypothetical protein, partial [Streptomyces clavuligerus]
MADDTGTHTEADGPRGGGASRRGGKRRGVVATAVAVGAVGVVAALLYGQRENEDSAPAAPPPPATAGAAVCARVIAQGTVVRTEPQGDRARVTLAVDRYLKPSKGPRNTAFTVERAEAGFFTPGDRMLVSVPASGAEPVQSYTGAEVAHAWKRLSAELDAGGGA